jgi:hypothetical protein
MVLYKLTSASFFFDSMAYKGFVGVAAFFAAANPSVERASRDRTLFPYHVGTCTATSTIGFAAAYDL